MFSCLFRFTKVRGLPPVAQIEPTNRCNLHCYLCLTGLGKLRRHKGDMSIGNFERIIDQLEKGIIYLVLYNLGEPLLNPDIYKMVQYAKRKKVFVRLSTNGDFYNKANIKHLVNCGIDELVISLDCATPQTYKSYKKSDGFERVVENVKLIVKERGDRLKPFIKLQLLAMKDTEREIPQFRELVRSLKVDKGLIKTLRVDFPDIVPDKSFLPQNSKYMRKTYKNEHKGNICYRPWISTVILWDGSVVPCCYDMEGKYNFGNVFNENFKQIWNNERYVSFRRQLLKESNPNFLCKECSLKDFLHDLFLCL